MLSALSASDLSALLLTFQLASVTLLILLCVSLPLAWWLARTKSGLKPVIETLTALPLILPPTVLGFYVLIALGNGSAFGRAISEIWGAPLAFSFPGLVIASCFYSLPFVVQPLQASFEKLDRSKIEAAQTLGASWFKTFALIVLPTIRKSLIVASVLGFSHTVGEFGVVLMVGGNIPGATQTVSIAIFEHVETLNYGAAHNLSAILLLFSFVVLFVVYHLQARQSRQPLRGELLA